MELYFGAKNLILPAMRALGISFTTRSQIVSLLPPIVITSYNKYSLLASLNPSTGAQNWLTNSDSFAFASKVAVSPNGEIFMTGSFGDNNVGPNNWGSDILLARFSSAGVLLQTKYTGVVNSIDNGNGIAFDTNGNYFITGSVGCTSPPCTFNGVPMYGADDTFILKNLP